MSKGLIEMRSAFTAANNQFAALLRRNNGLYDGSRVKFVEGPGTLVMGQAPTPTTAATAGTIILKNI